MTDKQIIIDGIDVSGCSALIEDYQRANNIDGRYEHIKNVCELGERGVEEFWFECKNNPNCHYKNWKRKEQECEELKEERDTLSVTRNKLLDDLWVAEENLKDYIEHFNKASDGLDQLKAENDELKGIRDSNFLHALEEQKRADKYFKTLTEIKFWVREFLKRTGQVVPNEIKEILQIISEVEND